MLKSCMLSSTNILHPFNIWKRPLTFPFYYCIFPFNFFCWIKPFKETTLDIFIFAFFLPLVSIYWLSKFAIWHAFLVMNLPLLIIQIDSLLCFIFCFIFLISIKPSICKQTSMDCNLPDSEITTLNANKPSKMIASHLRSMQQNGLSLFDEKAYNSKLLLKTYKNHSTLNLVKNKNAIVKELEWLKNQEEIKK